MPLWPNNSRTRPPISSGYGPRTGGYSNFHEGVDFIDYPTVHAVLPGTVTWAAWYNGAAGNGVVYVPDGHPGVEIKHFHVDGFYVSKGQRIAAGQRIASVGRTGNASGLCDHFEVRVNGKRVDPLAWLEANGLGEAAASVAFPATQKYGASWVRFLQDLLNVFGHKLAVDGKDGAKTQAAVLHEQKAAKSNGYGAIAQDRIGGPEVVTYLLWAFLKFRAKGEKAAGQPARTLYGSAWVRFVQRMLNELGHGLTVDGQDGSKTRAAVAHEQRSAKKNGYGALKVDETAGFETAKYLVWAIVRYRLPWS